MKSQDLEVDKIYYQKSHYEYIFKCSVKGMCRYSFGINLATKGFNKDTDCIYEQKELREATFSERLWLQKCIDANKFISKEEALKHSLSECLFWMKQMKCWIKDSKIKCMIFTDIYLRRHNP